MPTRLCLGHRWPGPLPWTPGTCAVPPSSSAPPSHQHACVHACTHTCLNERMNTCIRACVRLSICPCVRPCIRVASMCVRPYPPAQPTDPPTSPPNLPDLPNPPSPSVHPSVRPPVSFSPSVHPSVRVRRCVPVSFCPCACPSIRQLSVCNRTISLSSIRPSIVPSCCRFVSVHPRVRPSVHPLIEPSVHVPTCSLASPPHPGPAPAAAARSVRAHNLRCWLGFQRTILDAIRAVV